MLSNSHRWRLPLGWLLLLSVVCAPETAQGAGVSGEAVKGEAEVGSRWAVQSAGCTNMNWMDRGGDDCLTYERLQWCANGQPNASGWLSTYGSFSDWAVNGTDATAACCACGGGVWNEAANSSSGGVGGDPNGGWCGTQYLYIGPSAHSVKTVPTATFGLQCPPVCGRGCCVNKDYASDPADYTVWVGDGQVVVQRQDQWVGWSTGLIIPCYSTANCSGLPDAGDNNPMGRAFAMGLNYDGQLGTGTQQQAGLWGPQHVLLPPQELASRASLGGRHSALLVGSVLFMTGANDFGQLGIGPSDDVSEPTVLTARNGQPIMSAALGFQHSAYLAGGELYTFGWNANGQLGINSVESQPYPQLVVAPNGRPVVSVSLGHSHSAFIAGGELYTFGSNVYGQLGLGGAWEWHRPIRVEYNWSQDVVEEVVCGGYHTFARSGWQWYVFGSNQDGQLGLGPPLRPQSAPVALPFAANLSNTTVALGLFHSALLAGGKLFMFGLNDDGQLGLGDMNRRLTPSSLQSLNGMPITAVSLGNAHSAFIAGDQLFLFGRNAEAQLGLPPFRAAYLRPTPLTMSANTSVWSVALGGRHTMFITALTRSPTLTPTPLLTRTLTPIPTQTPTPTSTQTFAQCTAVFDGRTLYLNETEDCVQTLTVRVGSSLLIDRTLRVYQDPRDRWTVSVRLLRGCGCTRPGCPHCPDCATRSGLGWAVPVAVAPEVELLLVVRQPPPPAAGRPSPHPGRPHSEHTRLAALAGRPGPARLVFVAASSGLLIAVACLVGAVLTLALLLVFPTFRLLQEVHYGQSLQWRRNVRLQSRAVRAMVMLGAALAGAGAGWCLVVLTYTDAEADPLGLLAGGVCLAVAGLALQLGLWGWALRDPVQHRCPVCAERVSRWRFCGTYLPPLKGQTAGRKAHSQHTRCVQCRASVVLDGWPEAPLDRPYHHDCWRQHCRRAVAEAPEYAAAWCQQQGLAATDVELAHLLAACIRAASLPHVRFLLGEYPYLSSVPVAEEAGLTALHVAAAAGDLGVLEELVCRSVSGPIDSPCQLDHSEQRSLLITQLDGDSNDLYIPQPSLRYNELPVYVGLRRGRYLYYHRGDPGEASPRPTGWCVGPHLGGCVGATQLRLEALLGCPSAFPQRRASETAQSDVGGNMWAHLFALWQQKKKKKGAGLDSASLPVPPTLYRGALGSEGDLASLPLPAESQSQEMLLVPPAPAEESPSVWATQHTPVSDVCWGPEALGLRIVPHGTSVLQVAAAEGHKEVLTRLLALNQERYGHCLRWRYEVGHGLWEPYSEATQQQISRALAAGEDEVLVNPAGTALRLSTRQHVTRTAARQMEATMPAVIYFLDGDRGQSRVTSDVSAVTNWDSAFVLLTPSHLAAAAPNGTVLAQLHAQGFVDHSLLAPPCKDGSRLMLPDVLQLELLTRRLVAEVAAAMELDPRALPRRTAAGLWQSRSAQGRATGLGRRLTDGLQSPAGAPVRGLHQRDYDSTFGTLPFCARLDANPLGLRFERVSLTELAEDAVLKVHELNRQQAPVKVRYAVAIFVYTYELQYGDQQEEYNQIYAAINEAMRAGNEAGLDFWRPLICELNMSLEALPPTSCKLYRGIDCQFSGSYHPGAVVCWPAFSSATRNKRVAEDFAHGDGGTLFFLQGWSARCIERLSRYPDEEEVLFLPNTTFRITSTLLGTTDIGKFYSRVDNIAMEECDATDRGERGMFDVPPGVANLLVQVPEELTMGALTCLANLNASSVVRMEWLRANPDHIRARMVLGLTDGPPSGFMRWSSTGSPTSGHRSPAFPAAGSLDPGADASPSPPSASGGPHPRRPPRHPPLRLTFSDAVL